jgi:hypothetical protein
LETLAESFDIAAVGGDEVVDSVATELALELGGQGKCDHLLPDHGGSGHSGDI